jgi:hypothetical protein
MNAAAAVRLLQLVFRLIGYVSAAKAAADGYTHHGKYCGLPIWIKAAQEPEIAFKWAPLDHVIKAIVWIDQTVRELQFPDAKPGFDIWQGPPIAPARPPEPPAT